MNYAKTAQAQAHVHAYIQSQKIINIEKHYISLGQ